jgi:catechol 2,3-dioxygenase-like lactoylglutathione lyase family enzyme
LFSHIQLGARDLPRMIAFYDAVLATLGLVRIVDTEDEGPRGGVAARRCGMAAVLCADAVQWIAGDLGKWGAGEFHGGVAGGGC